ncbi:MAG: matrixin family metalloprotease [Lysobacterales bacterium]
MHEHRPHWPILLTLLLVGNTSSAFEVFPFVQNGETLYLKWGDNRAGTPAGSVFWSLIPPGTPGDAAFCADACPGNSVDTLQFEIAPGAGFAPRSLASLEPQIVQALAAWSAHTGITFIRLPGDSGLPINAAGALPPATGQIRIGVFAFASGGGAVGFAPPPNGGSGAGDILFDANSFYQFAPGNEGDPYSTQFAPNDFASLLLHELGHAIGLAHPVFDGSCPVMQIDPACFGRINRVPDDDDRAGAQFLYGHLFANGFED